ncbi:phage head closure protein [Psychrobacter sp. 16-MNA-CIBAN-0192]|uniref:phage head closure protein n=1 Tax=Psychrobacter sp. 16-MNA-CIBAN-0192 TaxID=3140448 RepID=UPI00331D4635
MRAGKLRNRITVYKSQSGRSPTGAVLPPQWIPWIVLWASLEPLSVKDVMSAQAAGSEITARCTLRYRTDITTAMQIECRGQRYEINGNPLPDAKSGSEYMTLMLRGVK